MNSSKPSSNEKYNWHPKLSAALFEISKHYVIGCVDYYSQQKPDPWQAEHDILESMLKIGDDVQIKKAIDTFETNCKLLVQRFKK